MLLIDIQRDYFPGGRHPLVGSDNAADAAASVLGAFRAGSEPVVHVQHSWDEPDAAYLKPGTPGFEHDDRVAPAEDEPVVIKQAPNAFVGTDLERRLRSEGIDQLVVAGMMTSMCVDATVRAAVDLGFAVTVLGDACAAPDLEYAGVNVPGEQVHAAFIAALADGYADVIRADTLPREPRLNRVHPASSLRAGPSLAIPLPRRRAHVGATSAGRSRSPLRAR